MSLKRKKRIMSIDELYDFCLKNNFTRFNSNDFGKELVVHMNGNFEKNAKNEDKHKEALTPFVSRAFHDHVNLNKSEIPEESFNENVPSANFRPILAHLTTNSDGEPDFGSHDCYVSIDEEGNEKIIYEEQPIGVIDGSKTTIEYDKDSEVNRAVLHGYLYDEYCQDAIDILNRRGTVDCSIELCIRDLSYNTANKTLMLNDFYVSGLTLLSKDVSPGMAGSNFKIEDFAVNAKPLDFDKKDKMIELLESLNEKLSNFNKSEQTSVHEESKEGGNDENMKFEELLAKYGKTAEDVTFDYEGMSDEELDAKFAEVFGDDDTNEDGDNSNEPSNDEGEGDEDSGEDNTEAQFEKLIRTYEISHEDIRYALYSLLAPYEDSDDDYYYISAVYDDYFVYEGWCTDKIYRQAYTKDGDNVAFDGERIELFRELLTAGEKAELESMRSNYSSISEELKKYQAAEENEKKDKLFESDDYKGIAETEQFAELKENHAEISLDELTSKLDEMLLSYAKSGSITFSATESGKTPTKKKLIDPKKKTHRDIYGGLFSKK